MIINKWLKISCRIILSVPLSVIISSCSTSIDKVNIVDYKTTSTNKPTNFILDILKDEKQFSGNVLARIGEREITVNKFKGFVQTRERKDLDKIAYDKRKAYLEEMIDSEVMLIAALKHNLDKNEEIITKAKEKLRDISINWMFKLCVTDKIIISDEEINKRIKLDRKKDETIETAKKRIGRKIFNKKKKELDNIWTAQCYKDANVSYNYENMKMLAKRWAKTKNKIIEKNPRFPFIQKKDFDLSESEKNTVMATFNDGEITVEDVINELSNIVPPKRPRPSFDSIKKLTEYALISPVLGKKAFDENFHNAKEVREVLADKIKSQLISKIQKIEVWDKIKDMGTIEKDEKTMENWKKDLRSKLTIEINSNFAR